MVWFFLWAREGLERGGTYLLDGLSAWFHQAPPLIYEGDSLLTAALFDGVHARLSSGAGLNLWPAESKTINPGASTHKLSTSLQAINFPHARPNQPLREPPHDSLRITAAPVGSWRCRPCCAACHRPFWFTSDEAWAALCRLIGSNPRGHKILEG